MTRATKVAVEQQARRSVSGAPAAPDGWAIPMDREHPIKDGLAACERYGISLSGSTFEKMHREAARFDFAAYKACGVDGDRKKVQALRAELARLAGRRGGLVGHGRSTTETDAAIESIKVNMAACEKRIAAAGGVEDQASRADRLKGLRRQLSGLESQAARIRATPGAKVPAEIEDEIDRLTLQLDEAEASFEVGGAELAELIAAKSEAERAARNGLATTLRDRVMEKIADVIRDAMRGKVALHLRRPEKDLPAEVQRALYEAKTICDIADRLDGEAFGLAPLAALLSEDLRGLLFPGVAHGRELSAWRRRTAKSHEKPAAPADGLVGATL